MAAFAVTDSARYVDRGPPEREVHRDIQPARRPDPEHPEHDAEHRAAPDDGPAAAARSGRGASARAIGV